jgi:hypothetical protein
MTIISCILFFDFCLLGLVFVFFIQLNAFMLHVLYLQQTKTEDNQLNETKALQKAIRQANKKIESAKQS